MYNSTLTLRITLDLHIENIDKFQDAVDIFRTDGYNTMWRVWERVGKARSENIQRGL